MRILGRLLGKIISQGTLTIRYADGSQEVLGTAVRGWPDVAIRFTDDAAARAILTNPALGAAEGFMDGKLIIEQGSIWNLIMLVAANSPLESGKTLDEPSLLGWLGERIKHWRDNYNKRSRSKANVAHHYDLSDKLYALFLDKDRQYSCAYFTDPDAVSLEQAQIDKKAHIAAKLDLKPGQQVLDIGCGWGGMALYLNRVADVDVLGVTLSEEQLKVARRRAQEAGVADRVRFELIDYRDVNGTFDRIVSVGMFEHVGVRHYREFFRTCHNLLKPDGVMLLHTIGRLNGPSSTDGFMRKYIFPGGYAPALSEIMEGSEPNRLLLTDIEVLRMHYYYTLEHWYQRTLAAKTEIVALYDERFFRMWTFYLAAAASGFLYGSQTIYQLQFVRKRHTLPITRDYMAQAEARYRAKG
ncbi:MULTISPECIES: SAM-dependent methyltransferase [unclassified Sphingobium]|uniref:SAM-dependent methyltransferase n=1 Tax=unclassified Sphingobium TaxID=2611147 RepID=UPI00222488B9|nr:MULTISPECIES: cyclopropane-fatty-acyl-phospholipid synthase family protein [unclassified Sphingobium]MCW2413080.1 cyclopropane-fatty-acyl-phospholipid synthase [Sphingobium sp. B8D3D]MCW2414622.1 cyclopropane-fatty-acyl-phospholipid synthase [Sphingobium sp. B8D3A]